MRRASLALALILGLAFPTAAMAEDNGDDDGNQNYTNTQTEDDSPSLYSFDENDSKHRHFDDKYDDVTRVVIPPLAIRPGTHQDPQSYPLPNVDPESLLDPAETSLMDAITDGLTGVSDNPSGFRTTQIANGSVVKLQVSPSRSKPVQLKSIVITAKTPSDDFMQHAVVLGGFLAVVAFGLLALTSFQTISFRRKIN